MGNKTKQNGIKKNGIKVLPVIISILLLAVLVWAAAPTTPNFLSPTNQSTWFNNTLTCSGSTDSDGDGINYLLWYQYNSTANILVQNATTSNYNYFNFAPLDRWDNECTAGQSCTFRYGTNLSSPYLLQSTSAGGPVVNFSNSYKFNMDYWPVYVWGDAVPRRIYVDTFLVYSSSSAVSANYLEFINVTNFTDGSNHDILFSMDTTNSNQQMFFWFEHENATIMCQAQDDTNVYSGNLTNFYNLPIFKPCPTGNRALYVTFEGENDTGTKINGTINNLQLTFDDDTTSGYLYSVQDTISTLNYTYCMNPPTTNLPVSGTLTYSGSGYPQRTTMLDRDLNGSYAYPLTLYLLPTADGIYVTFQVIDVGNNVLSDVTVTASKVLDGTLTLISSGTTDSSGTITFWLDPNTLHTITAEKAGVGSTSFTLVPTQSSYTITLGGATLVNQTNPFFGVIYSILPTNVILTNNTNYNFTFTIDSSYWNLSGWGFTLYNSTSVITTQSNNSIDGGTIVYPYNTGNNTIISMDYWWLINGNYTNLTKTWNVRYTYTGVNSIKQFFTDLSSYGAVGFNAGYDPTFGGIILSLILIITVAGYLTYQFGIYSPMGIMGIIWLAVWFLEYVNIMPILVRKYVLSALLAIILLGYYIQEQSR